MKKFKKIFLIDSIKIEFITELSPLIRIRQCPQRYATHWALAHSQGIQLVIMAHLLVFMNAFFIKSSKLMRNVNEFVAEFETLRQLRH